MSQQDCDDSDPEAYPGAEEVCNEKDNDCDGAVDNGVTTTWYPDLDGDSYGGDASPVEACTLPEGYLQTSGDCDDGDPNVYPGADELCDAPNAPQIDHDCDGIVDAQYDLDGDGFKTCGNDCNDLDPAVYPGAIEDCDDTLDNDCDGTVNEDVDLDGDGWTTCGVGTDPGDCNDDEADIYPGAEESCNGLDDSCDGIVDEGFPGDYFHDNDGDGFGQESAANCGSSESIVSARGDCDDQDPNIYPGAGDVDGDGVDTDCGGHDPSDPHVGLGLQSYTSIQAALNAAQEGAIIWVGPGYYAESDLGFSGKALTLASTHGADMTDIDGGNRGTRVAQFTSGEGNDTILDGFTLKGGGSQSAGGEFDGGAVYAYEASPTIRNCIITGNVGDDGGGIYLYDSNAVISNCTFTNNSADYSGGGIYLYASNIVISNCTFANNSAGYDGGGIYADQSDLLLTDCAFSENEGDDGGGLAMSYTGGAIDSCTFEGNSALYYGGGISLYYSSPSISDCQLERNSASSGGGGIRASYSDPVISDCTMSGNDSSGKGGGGYFNASSSAMTNCLVHGNISEDNGGGLYFTNSSSTITNCSVVGNRSDDETGGIYMTGSSASQLLRVFIAYNIGYNLGLSATPDQFVDCAVFSPWGLAQTPDGVELNYIGQDPLVASYTHDDDISNDDLHLLPGSPLIQIEDAIPELPASCPPAIGAYGGHDRKWCDYYLDADEDGIYDGWETVQGLSPALDDAQDDFDQDGVSNILEFEAGLDPNTADMDNDGFDDGLELSAGSDPESWYSQPETPNRTAYVETDDSTDFETIQAAIDAIPPGGQAAIRVGPGTWAEPLDIEVRTVSLGSTNGAEATLLVPADGSAIHAEWSTLDIRDFTVTGGHAEDGGGLYLSYCTGTLDSMVIIGNTSDDDGGGIHVRGKELEIANSIIQGNTADSSGAGIYATEASLTVRECTVSGNTATSDGGGIYGSQVTFTLQNNVFSANVANDDGGGIYGDQITLTLQNSIFSANVANDAGGGATFYSLEGTIDNCMFEYNDAYSGGGLYINRGTPEIANCVWVGNHADYKGGAVFQYAASPRVTNGTIVGSSADQTGGGVYLNYRRDGVASPEYLNMIIAYNSPDNLFKEVVPGAALTLTYSNLYNEDPTTSHNLPSLDGTNTTVEPGFLSYDADNIPDDTHLGLLSRIVATGSPEIEDADGSRSDPGGYGGANGDQWDLDLDGYPDYFWPGTISDSPPGHPSDKYDTDDRDPDVH